MEALAAVREASGSTGPGPAATFTSAHVLFALLTIGKRTRIGRQELATACGLGEGATRTLLKKIRNQGLAETSTSGCHLTKKGERVYASLSEKVTIPINVETTGLSLGSHQAAAVVRSAKGGVLNGIEQRDAAIKVGASGASTFLVKHDKFTMPNGSSDCEGDYPSPVWPKVREELHPKNGDVLILSGGATVVSACIGAVSAALTLL